MVTAGLYLILRINPIFSINKNIMILLMVLGSVTALFGSLTALFQYDIKRIIAFSTCSQLGYMASSLGSYNYEGSFNHLISHAFFKALLFLLAGLIIHKLNNEQDIQKRGGLYVKYPLYYIAMLIGNLSLCAIISSSGFYSKEFIIEVMYYKARINRSNIYIRLYIGSIITVMYSIRSMYIIFYRNNNSYKYNSYINNKHIISLNAIIVIIRLSILSRVSGYLMSEFMNPINLTLADNYNNSSYIRSINSHRDMEYINKNNKKNLIRIYPYIIGITMLLYIGKRYRYKIYLTNVFINNLNKFFNEKRRVDKIRNKISSIVIKEAASIYFILIDKALIETIMSKGIILSSMDILNFFNNNKSKTSKIAYSIVITIILINLI